MIIVTVNSGSTSIKLAAFKAEPAGELRPLTQEHRSGEHLAAGATLREFMARLPAPPQAMAHRVVHGGIRFVGPVLIDAAAQRAIEELSELAPLHNPKALQWIAAARDTAPELAQVAVFDTSFFHTLPRVAAEYALPAELGMEQGVRRYGFHGLAHESLWDQWCALSPHLQRGGKLITVQLGGGCSAAAIDQGRPLDTTMGFSPLEGLVMASRSGDVDPGIVPYLAQRLSLSAAEIIDALNHRCGLAGMASGNTDLNQLSTDPSEQAQFALGLYCYRVRKAIGAYLAVLGGGCDGIVFGGGVGEHVPVVRERILMDMKWAGIELDPAANAAAQGQPARIDASGSRIRIHVLPTNEEAILVKAAMKVLE